LPTVVQRTLAAPLDPPRRFTAIVRTPRFCSAPALLEDIEIVPVAAAAANAVQLVPKQNSSAESKGNMSRRECMRSPFRSLFCEQRGLREKKATGRLLPAARDYFSASRVFRPNKK
jgi:hypothetical protein